MINIIFKPGWKAVKAIYPKKNWTSKIWRPMMLTLVMFCSALYAKSDSLELIDTISSWIVNGYPSILGFVLSGYVLLIGFVGSDFLLALERRQRDDGVSLFQMVNSTFVVVISVVLFTYMLGALFGFVHKCHIEWPFDNQLYVYYNYGALVAILFSFAYSLFALYDVLINIFNMGQFATALTRKRLKSMRNDKRRDTNE